MTTHHTASNLQHNLRTVAAQFPSVAEFCRNVGLNRQQFNKYLAGTHVPSRRTIDRIAQHIGITNDDLSLANPAFKVRLNDRREAGGEDAATPNNLDQLRMLARESVVALKPFLGTYYRYHPSSISPGKIVRAVTILYASGGCVNCLTVERFPAVPGSEGGYSFFYTGVCYLLGDRIFIMDYERRQKNEMTNTILMPQYRTPLRYLFGLLSGIVASTYREPYSTRVVFERRSDDQTVRKSKLRLATLLASDHADFPPAIKRYFLEAGEHRSGDE
ncbi:helix-turn-helix domain-containing protein [Paraburkholderia sp. RL17-337-BIB-A]|uniref:helix-turn-helix domain-containing protein n=1 Tax=Paraburkholderia sp. RL17-337-BIB-A TaxID=3031636 RepID=UPI0038B6C08F